MATRQHLNLTRPYAVATLSPLALSARYILSASSNRSLSYKNVAESFNKGHCVFDNSLNENRNTRALCQITKIDYLDAVTSLP